MSNNKKDNPSIERRGKPSNQQSQKKSASSGESIAEGKTLFETHVSDVAGSDTADSKTASSDAANLHNGDSEKLPQRRAEDRRQTNKNSEALTEINRLFQSQNSEHGFMRAQNDVNEVLKEKKIRLNQRFDLVSVIGTGGMGTVYKARDLRKVEAQDANPYVAVKVLNSDFRHHPDAFKSLQREASRSHILSHPNIVTVHDFDRDGDTIYMTMELLKGEALDTYLAKHRKNGVPKPTALKIFSQICRALAFAHEKGIIHSDLKPANIFVSDQGVKILDFGIARLATESKLKDQFDAGTIGAITPAYASLEMLEKKEPDISDDVYAAAIITYELFAGHHPFQRKPAAAALGLHMQPRKIEGLTKRQWRGLTEALSFKREGRTRTIKDFHRAMTESLKVPIFKIVSAILFVVAGWFGYVTYFAPDELSQVIADTMKKANDCMQSGDYRCAISGADAVLEISPNDALAKALARKADKALKRENADKSFALELEMAENCLREQNYQCVLDKVARLEMIKPADSEITELAAAANSAIAARAEAEAQNTAAVNRYLNSATDCFKKRNYDCAIREANLALELNEADTDAEAIIQNANYAKRQDQENLKKANKILNDGRECFKKLNYSCAIAKSESALEFVPGLKAAMTLKSSAEKAIADAKKQILIE